MFIAKDICARYSYLCSYKENIEIARGKLNVDNKYIAIDKLVHGPNEYFNDFQA